ncbi:MAG: hypothetical protein C0507_23540 [Cyanobacteria bacterium PR.3.49]|nr:hypothetical protein [Cyanobacteria bacterium PR.3.49]
MSIQQTNAVQQFNPAAPDAHEEAVALEGLDHIFKWASEVVAEGSEDNRAKLAKEKRIRRQVLEMVQKYREQQILAKANEENAYLQRRVIALLQKLSEVLEENTQVKQIVVNQYWQLSRVPAMERELREYKSKECERDAAVTERKYLMTALAKLKVERDYLEDVANVNETENARLARMLNETKADLETLKSRRWYSPIVDLFKVK